MAENTKTIAKKRKKIAVFPIVNYFLFILIALLILIPIWKVIVDSLDAKTVASLRLLPKELSIAGYKRILSYDSLYIPLLNSVLTTIGGTLLGLVLSTLGGYVLIQFEMPGRNFFAYFLLFTMVFSGGMIPEFLVYKQLGLVNNLMAIVVKHGINVYNLVLMRNFFEGIPGSLYEAAKIDGCSPMGIFVKIVLPLSKAALASIGLMFAVGSWNDYTAANIYLMKPSLFTFQQQLKSMIGSGDLPPAADINTSTLANAAIMVAIIPFMILYPFLQKYFVKGVNIGAVKE